MSKTPSKDVNALNYFTPKEIYSPNKDVSGVSKTVYTHISRLNSLLNDWLSIKEKGVKICRAISGLKLYECVDDYYPHQMKPLTESLVEALNGLENIVEGVEIINKQMQALSQLESTPEAIINTWSCTEITDTISKISHMLQNEFKLKKVITENIAHCRDENLIEVYVSAWEFEVYFNMDASAYLFAEIIMNGGRYDNPVIQVLGNEKIQIKGEDMIRLLVSDGKHSYYLALLSSNLNDKVLIGWVIKARVFNKTAIRTWSNAKGEGKLFSMDLCDESGEIRAIAFKNECDKFYDMIQIDKVYYISRCQLKTVNKQFANLKNDYEMTFNADTVVSECMEEDNSVPNVKYDFMSICDIANKSPNTIIDVIGVCKFASDVQDVTAKNTGKLLKKREVTLVDSSSGAITLTLWNNEAEKFEGSNNPVVAIKGARLTEFNGIKSLSCNSSMLRVDPDVLDAHKLRGWYDNEGNSMPIAIPTRSGQSGGNTELMTFAEVEDQRLGTGDKADYFSLLGVLTFTFAENAVYKACPQEQCNKKLVDQHNGLYRCEKCDREHPNYKYQLLLAATVSDPTGDQRVMAFNESAEALLGRTAEEVGRLFEYDKTAYGQLFDEVKFKTFVFKLRTKMETYNNEARLKTVVMNVQPVDYRDANARLIKNIKALSGVEV